jgi:hypothetical protein
VVGCGKVRIQEGTPKRHVFRRDCTMCVKYVKHLKEVGLHDKPMLTILGPIVHMIREERTYMTP